MRHPMRKVVRPWNIINLRDVCHVRLRSGGGFFATRDENGKIAAVIHAVKIRASSKPKPQHSTFSMILQSLTLGAAKRIPELVQSTDPALKDLFKRINDTMETRGKLLDNVPNKLHAKHGPAPHHYYVTIMAVEPIWRACRAGSTAVRIKTRPSTQSSGIKSPSRSRLRRRRAMPSQSTRCCESVAPASEFLLL